MTQEQRQRCIELQLEASDQAHAARLILVGLCTGRLHNNTQELRERAEAHQRFAAHYGAQAHALLVNQQ